MIKFGQHVVESGNLSGFVQFYLPIVGDGHMCRRRVYDRYPPHCFPSEGTAPVFERKRIKCPGKFPHVREFGFFPEELEDSFCRKTECGTGLDACIGKLYVRDTVRFGKGKKFSADRYRS